MGGTSAGSLRTVDKIKGIVYRSGDYDGTTDDTADPAEYIDLQFEGKRVNRYKINPDKTERARPGESMRQVFDFVGYVPDSDEG
jgi:hypothetical protein